jgi:hypothetical protein
MATAASDDGKMRNPLFAGSLDDSANVDAPPRYSSDIAWMMQDGDHSRTPAVPMEEGIGLAAGE